jgi:hypothetical protein
MMAQMSESTAVAGNEVERLKKVVLHHGIILAFGVGSIS